MKILVIDDNQDNQISMKALIKDAFPDVLTFTASNGKKGLELAASEDPDVILLDIVMPGMDGFDVCRKLKSEKMLSDIPVVFITALKGDRESRVQALECGADAFLAKPVEEIEFVAQIRAMAKIKSSNLRKRDEKEHLASLVKKQTRELQENYNANLNLMEDLGKENETRKKSEGMLRDLIKNIPDIVMRIDRDGRYLFVSDNVREMINLQAAQFIGKTPSELGLPGGLCRFFAEAIQKVFDSGIPYDAEFTLEGKNRPVIQNWRFLPEYDSQGVIKSLLSLGRDITAHRQAEEKYQLLFNEMLEGFALHEIICDDDGKPSDYRFLAVNPAFERMTGLTQDVLGRTVLEMFPKTKRHWIEIYGKAALTVEPVSFENYSAEINKTFEITAFRPAPSQFACIFTDITERRQIERRQALTFEILGIINRSPDLPDMINGVLAAIKKETGFDAVGIRLKNGDDFPYYGHAGFSNDFLLTENTLVERNMDGGVCMDKDGKPCLQCTCGLVISGKTDPANPLFTPDGTFWTNNSLPLLNLPAEQDPRLHPRNVCIHDGYASVALIPIRADQEIIGLLQLNNRKENSLSLGMVRSFEGISSSIGVALMQIQAKEALRKSEARHIKMLANIGDVIVIIDKDGINRYKSPNIEKLFGWRPEDLVGVSAVKNVHPEDLSASQKFFTSLMSTPNATGTIECRYRCKDGSYRWIEFIGMNLLQDEDIKGLLGNYQDISNRKRAETVLRQKMDELRANNAEMEQFNRAMIGRELRMIELKQEINELCRRLGEPPHHAMDQLQTDSVPGADPVPAPPGGGGV